MDSSIKKIPYHFAKDVIENVKEAEDTLEIMDETESATKKGEEILPRLPVNRPRIKMRRFTKSKISNNTGNTYMSVRDVTNDLKIVNDVDGDTENSNITGNTSRSVREDKDDLKIVTDVDGDTKVRVKTLPIYPKN